MMPASTQSSAAIEVVRDRELSTRPGGQPFTINFIRDALLPLRVRRIALGAGLAVIAANVLVAGLLVSLAMAASSESARIAAALGGQQPDPKATAGQMRELYQQASTDLAKLRSATSILEQRLPLAPKLAALSRTLPARTWISQISGSREDRRIRVQALYVIDPENPYEVPTKPWVDALQADKGFSRGLRRLELASSSRKTQGDAELFAFELVAEWNPL